MRTTIIIGDPRIGSVQVFSMRLAPALYKHGHQVWLHSHYPIYISYALVNAAGVQCTHFCFRVGGLSTLNWLIGKAEGIVRRFGRRSVRAHNWWYATCSDPSSQHVKKI